MPVAPQDVRIESVGLNPLDLRRLDVAVDLSLCIHALCVEMVIVGPEDDELCSTLLIDTRDTMIDKVMHLRQDAAPGQHTLHIGVFYENALVTRASRHFSFFSRQGDQTS